MTNDASPSANVESSPGTYKIMTIIATVLCLCLLGASIFLGSGAHSQSTKAAQTRADTESLRAKKKDAETETANVRTQIASTKDEGSAKTWCDEFTSAYSTPKSLTNASGELSVKTQNQRDAIAQLCPEKKAFVEALHASPESSFEKSSQTCEITDEGLTFSETMTITNKQLSDLGEYRRHGGPVLHEGNEAGEGCEAHRHVLLHHFVGRQRNLLGEPARPRRTRRELHHQGAEHLDERLVSNPCPTHHRPKSRTGMYTHE